MVDARSQEALVSVGIPTYNRFDMLRRAVESVLMQDYPSVELIISDNASTDGTQAWCEDLCQRDNRVRYIRQRSNVGLVANYNQVFSHARGDYYMAFADDDWLDGSYISQCIQRLRARPDLVLVCGKWRWFEGQEFVREGDILSLLQESGRERVLTLYKKMDVNTFFHGVVRRDLVARIPPLRNTTGADWPYAASLAFVGKIETSEETAINKSLGGASATWVKTVHVQGLRGLRARFWYLDMALAFFTDIIWISPVYRSSSLWARFSLAYQVSIVILWRLTGRPLPSPLVRLFNSRRLR